jgi:hypothetical protein
MAHVLRRTDQGGGYVQPAGSRKTYGGKATARRFATRESAEADRCPGNEVIEEVQG